MSIELNSINKFYGSNQALYDITATLPTASLTALVGPSGSGKSTLLRVIAGLESMASGRVGIEGRDVSAVPVRDRNIGFCFQDYAPFRHMTVAQNVAYGLRVRKVPRAQIHQRVGEMLDRVGLAGFDKRYPSELSGGQRQRMALARALIIEPDVLLLDEPFAALDAQVRGDLRTWVRSLQRELAITTILVTHDQSEAMEVADQLVVLNAGRIEQSGSPSELYDEPANEFVRGFVGPSTSFRGERVRPHALQLTRGGEGEPCAVRDVVHLGFEVRVVVDTNSNGSSWVQLTHDEAARLQVSIGESLTLSLRTGRESHSRNE